MRHFYINKSNGISVIIVACICIYGVVSDIDECLPAPCLNGGQCTNGLDQYTCTCVPGWQGTNCEQGKCNK